MTKVVLTDRIELQVPVTTLFSFYTNAQNLLLLAPPFIQLRLIQADSPLVENATYVFGTRPKTLPFEIKWTFQIETFSQDQCFEERLLKGPFPHWQHRHDFEDIGPNRSAVKDTLTYSPPTGLFAAIASADSIKARLQDAYRHREQVLRRALEEESLTTTPGIS